MTGDCWLLAVAGLLDFFATDITHDWLLNGEKAINYKLQYMMTDFFFSYNKLLSVMTVNSIRTAKFKFVTLKKDLF